MAKRQQIGIIRAGAAEVPLRKALTVAQAEHYAAFSAAVSTIRTTSAMMRFNSKSLGV
jgi:hypothetical protein